MNRIMIAGTQIESKDLISGTNVTAHAMAGETLSVDQLICVVNTEPQPVYDSETGAPQSENGHLVLTANPIDVTAFKDGDEVFYYDGETLAGKYFFESVTRQGPHRYKITAVSIIGRLLNSRHYGGIYVGALASAVFAEILSGTSYTLDPDVASATVTGYLPIATRRDNLQQLLIATGATIRVDSAGRIYITAMSPVSTGIFDASRVYAGGSVITGKPVSGVKLTEHNYFPAGNIVTLFSDGVDGEELIEFNQPYHDLAIEGGTIVESGANFARISAKGTVTLTGQPYTHVTRIVTAGTVDAGSQENVKNISSCYLANPQIAQSLVERFYSYLQCNRSIQQDVITGSERAGDVVSVINPYTMEQETATIQKFDVTMSSVNKARATFLLGFTPSGVISGFKNHVMLTGSGTWTVPDGVYKIRMILVGGGTGGGGGRRGTAGGDASFEEDGAFLSVGLGGAGGSPGKAGAGGRIFEISIDVTPGQVFSFAAGAGGIGGTGQTADANESEGAAGEATTFGGYSSDYGRLYPYGYYEAKTGLTLAAAGLDGYTGGRGGNGNDEQYWWDDNDDWHYYYAEDGEDVAGFAGGSGAHYREDSISERNEYQYYGGGGGGAAYGAEGGDAPGLSGYSSAGGVGATGTEGLTGVNPGQGGGAGNGGGGGGGGGKAFHWSPTYDNSAWMNGPGGEPGNGSRGGTGAAGAIILYY